MGNITWHPLQQQVLGASGNVVVLGPPGSGKSTLLVEKAAQLLASGYRGEDVVLATFAYRTLEVLKTMAKARLGATAETISTGTLKDFALASLRVAGNKAEFASNNTVRRYLRALMVQQQFEGTLAEAEHLIRLYKSRGKKVAENDRFYPFFNAYQNLLESRGQQDRHDILRQHILGIKNNTATPVQAKVMLVDNLQDATEIQLIWLKSHLFAGVKLVLAGNDDVTAYGKDGATGPAAFEQASGWEGMERLTLEATWRTPANIAPAVGKVARMLRERCDKTESPQNKVEGTVTVEHFATPHEEAAWLVAEAKKAVTKGIHTGIITRTHGAAALVTHMLQRGGVPVASYARLVWEEPTAQTVLALLYVLLNKASDGQLKLVLMGLGLPATLVEDLAKAGLTATDWLPEGCPLPSLVDASPTTITHLSKIRRLFTGAQSLMQAGVADARLAFKACMADMADALPEEEKGTALLAADIILSIQGKLAEALPRIMQESLPDTSSPVIVAPVKETRNLAFEMVIIPRAQKGEWPWEGNKLLQQNMEHERRLFYLALSRSTKDIKLSGYGASSNLVEELKQNLGKPPRR